MPLKLVEGQSSKRTPRKTAAKKATTTRRRTPAKKKAPETIAAAVEVSHRETLVALRRQLAKAMDDGNVAANALAAVSKRIEELDRQVRRLDEAAAEKDHTGGDADAAFDPQAL